MAPRAVTHQLETLTRGQGFAGDLAVLSACETGFCSTAGSEGLLGLQRAFQMAGATTVMAGLWRVPNPLRSVQCSNQRDSGT